MGQARHTLRSINDPEVIALNHIEHNRLSRRTAMISLSCRAGQQREVRRGPRVTKGSHSFYLPPTHGP